MADINGVERTYANKDEYDWAGGEHDEAEILEAMKNKENTISNQKLQVLAYVRTNGSITPREADNTYAITRLAAVIFDLKALGHQFVEPTQIIKGTNKFGAPCTWAKYVYIGRVSG
jgi:hypothetical protein